MLVHMYVLEAYVFILEKYSNIAPYLVSVSFQPSVSRDLLRKIENSFRKDGIISLQT